MKKGTMLWVGLVWVSALTLAAERGPWAIDEVNLVLKDSTRGRKVEVLLLYPKGTEPLPWVVFSPGFLFTGLAYRSWGELLASHGMATALVSYAYSLFNPDHRVLVGDLLFILDTIPAEAQRYGVRLDPFRVALVGHSLGGKLSFLAAAERNVRAVVGLDPVDGGAPGITDPVRFPSAVAAIGSVRAPVLLLGAEYGERVKFGTPCAPQDANFRKFFEAAPGPALEVEQRGAGHVDYLDNPNCGLLCSVCWPGDDPTTTRPQAQNYVLLFLQGYLLREDQARVELRVLLSQDAQAGRVRIREKPAPIS
jgi:pimeloyl-ACP methyl ester carboxylesterase